MLVLAMACAMPGCRSAGPIFDEAAPDLAWPPPPKRPRIRYVGQITGAQDLKPARTGRDVLSRIFVGKKPIQPVYGPRAVACTGDGTGVWVADPGGRCLHRFDLARRTYLKIQDAGSSPLRTPVALALGPPGSLFVCDSEAVAIYQLRDSDGGLLRELRLPDEVIRPAALAYDVGQNELYVADVAGHDIKVLTDTGDFLRILGRRGEGPGEFNFPSAIALDDEYLWVADTGNHRVQAISRSGAPGRTFGRVGDAPGDLALPKGIAVDPDGHVYVVDGRFENVQVFTRQDELLIFFGEEGTGPGDFWLPGGIFIEPSGRIWVCDSYNRRVQVFQYVLDRQAEAALQP
jgi:DNA-binding beta-propeller fold protein YncE